MLFGISECQRSEKIIEVLKAGDYEKLGRMMNVSHNGDRVFCGEEPYDYSAENEKLELLISNLDMGVNIDKSLVINQGGGYACSTKEIDNLVDLACSCKDVLGAQLAGAGLGGCIVILVRNTGVNNLIETLVHEYYNPNGYPCGAQVYSPSSGSSVLS
jgi:N-acetylgalactosamine kinase